MSLHLQEEYRQQLANGCENAVCSGVFCNAELEDELVDRISETLSGYGSVFLCRNMDRVADGYGCAGQDVLRMRSKVLNFFFFVCLKTVGPRKNVRFESTSAGDSEAVSACGCYVGCKHKPSRKKCNVMESDEEADKSGALARGCCDEGASRNQLGCMKVDEMAEEELIMPEGADHSICELLSNKNAASAEDTHLIGSVFRLLVRKYEEVPQFTLGMVILRMYGMFSKHWKLTGINYPILCKILQSVRCVYGEMAKRAGLCEGIVCSYRSRHYKTNKAMCVYPSRLTKADLTMLVNEVSCGLNSSASTECREDTRVNGMLSMLYVLYCINEDYGILSHKRFYLHEFCERMDFREEFKYLRAKSKTALEYPFILPVHIKAELIKCESNDRMKSSLQDSFFKSLFEGHIDPYLFVTVDRETVYRDSIEIFKQLDPQDARKQLRTTFRNEEGVDSGGIRKEYFQLLSHEIRADSRLFEHVENKIWIKAGVKDECEYEAVGRIIAIALYNNIVLSIPFPRLFFKKLLEKKPTIEDLAEISPDVAMSLKKLRMMSKEEIDFLDLRFVSEYFEEGNARIHALVENGENIRLTEDNIGLFVEKYSEFYTDVLVRPQFEALKKGFYSVMEKCKLAYLNPKELEKIMMGSNGFDIKEIRSATTYSGFTEDSSVIVHFWEIFEAFDKKKRKKLLQFITGNDRIPVSGSVSLKLVIMRNGCDTDRLPSSQTCFNTLLLPEYSSKNKLEKKLETALELTAGFFLL
ncbi:ubiquitin-transferase [Ordospora pajunii]|uniref:ubiquitin-transferase n=1 Tax=Ordospora pajunii TaxID=3039483 RepID=UPI00295287F1|nr:ubiquitin-transferase [Ordospora pajunii]KAH9411646.1 ubiquitin-transferase [Ordospora pajunii]